MILYSLSHSIATAHYVLKKYVEEQVLREALFNLVEFVQVVSVDNDIIKKGLKSKHKDFEDAIQIYCAHKIEYIDYFVTRNVKDFRLSEIPAYAPDELLEKI